jgi:hypothetical protein|tara:strand:- start:125 stop:994 length:870 start_codon:yes stop_codon:yes gene_type:complete
MYIKHSKFKNTGILFELLVRKITADTLAGVDSPSVNILKKYFVNTELGKEYKLYETIFKSNNITESKANIILTTVLEASKKLNRKTLKREKYNIVKELREHYNVEDLFKTGISNYKPLASLYTLFEIYNSQDITDPNQIVDNKFVLLEQLTSSPMDKDNVKNDIIEEFKSQDKDIRLLTYRVLLENFNNKYSHLSDAQKSILKEFINSIDSTSKLKEFYNSKIQEIKNNLILEIKITKDSATKIKLIEINKFLTEIGKNKKINSDNLVDLLQYCNLLEELKSSHGSIQI